MNLARAQTKLGNTVRHRISRIDWHRIVEDLDARGFAVIGGLLTARDCRTIASFYPDDANFRFLDPADLDQSGEQFLADLDPKVSRRPRGDRRVILRNNFIRIHCSPFRTLPELERLR